MKHWFNKRLLASAITALALFCSKGALGADTLSNLADEIDSWHLKEARSIANGLGDSTKSTPAFKYLLGRLLFHEGDFKGALDQLREAIEGARAELGWKMLRDLCAQTALPYFPAQA